MSNAEIIFLLIIGVALVIFGGRIMFSDKALNAMYKSGYWKIDTVFLDEKSSRRIDRYYRGGHFYCWV